MSQREVRGVYEDQMLEINISYLEFRLSLNTKEFRFYFVRIKESQRDFIQKKDSFMYILEELFW